MGASYVHVVFFVKGSLCPGPGHGVSAELSQGGSNRNASCSNTPPVHQLMNTAVIGRRLSRLTGSLKGQSCWPGRDRGARLGHRLVPSSHQEESMSENSVSKKAKGCSLTKD